MRLSSILTAALAGGSAATFTEHDRLAAQGMINLGLYTAQNGYPSPKTCSPKNLSVRREWSLLLRSEKLNYIDAIKCLHSKPAKTPSAIASGAKNRYDDFVVTHIIQTYEVHGTANFLAWHRYFVWSYEQALRDECGYKGYQPYWNWAWWAKDPTKSPLLDGSDTSISGNGAYVAGRNFSCVPDQARCFIHLEPGSGGGCVENGPLKDWTVHLGPLKTFMQGLPPNPQADGLGYNPRCLARDLNKQAAHAARDEEIVSLIKGSNNVLDFQNTMQGDFAGGLLGVHSGGHYTVGGDAGTDLFNSPSDPAFFFHHAMVDRVWWIWQNQDIKNRQNALEGTITFLNRPPSRNGTLEDNLGFGDFMEFPNITNADAMSTLAGPFCYVYA
ncbi:Di-copper centre-containing protein [Dothidotthia symphoricarpi CBS 119687]|uniref:Di-copper centre-containing protein n=1 Tax=Dothidotthia symphoricarpi CBS 119687 TaxID=1392245 RepID=A0A6A6AJ64_9PLEO|nr:Di-copper centre-containing protein [Dothidotthia symphoricarpi CBS 119687]KAF2130944.1 Di-copper centre-containing protein [Dothidotthia symphoricarpi CBS 119687]